MSNGNRIIPEAEEILKGKLEEYLQAQGINTRRPFRCLNPEHPDQHPSMGYDGKRKKAHCFSCGADYSTLDLIGLDYGLTDYKDIMQKGAELFNLDITSAPRERRGTENREKRESSERAPEPPKAGIYKEYLESCRTECTEESKGYNYLTGRGFTPETIQRFCLGYDRLKDVITIPYSKNYSYYITRSIAGKIYKKPPAEEAGDEPIFNGSALYSDNYCFVCESPIDAISIMQAGGAAVALGGTGSGKLLKAVENRAPRHCLILCLDNDGSGQQAQTKAAEDLEKAGILFINAEFKLEQYEEPQKDPNDLLKGNPEQLRLDIAENVRAAKALEIKTGHGLHPVGDYKELFIEHQTADKPRISTGYHSLDRALYGGFRNELYILSAETSIGKSAITSCLAQNIAEQGIDVLYYALEMGRDEFIARGASMISKEDGHPVPYGEILNYTWDERLNEFIKRDFATYEPYLEEYIERYGQHLYIIEGGFSGKTAKEIAETAEQFKQEHHTEQLVIVIDYLQRLKADPEDRAQRDAMSITSAAVQVLGNLASQKRNTVIAISSISNAQTGQKITATAGKYSGDIAYTGGILLGWNWRGYTDTTDKDQKAETAERAKELGYREMYLEVLKNRSGDRDNGLTLYYYPPYNYFSTPEIKKSRKY